MKISPTLKAITFSMLFGIALAALMSEIAYQVLKSENREPMTVELVIPAGTAEQVAQGEIPPAIPEDMLFVVGDTLVVLNQDSVDHQLGPLWIPAGASASLNLDTEENYIMECSFQPAKFLGLTVREPVTFGTRLTGIFFGGLPMGALFAVYSILVIKKKEQKA